MVLWLYLIFILKFLFSYFLRWRNGVQRYLGEDISTLLKSTVINWFGDLIIIYFSLKNSYQWYLRQCSMNALLASCFIS